MKPLSWIQIIGLSTLITVSATSAFASGSEESDLRPVWMAERSVYGQNSALLDYHGNPSFAGRTFQQQILSNGAVQNIEQQYIARSRDYEMRENYGIASTMDESSYVTDMNGLGKSMFSAARLAPVRQYQKNFQQSEKQGEISQPVAVVGTAAALGSGTPIRFDLGDDARASWSGDLMNQHGEFNVTSSLVNAKVEMNMKDASLDPSQPLDPNGAAERYKISFNREVAFDITSSVIYGSSSNSFAASVSRPIMPHLSGSVGTTRPAGDNISGNPPEVSGGLSYGLTF